jgi:hypothetical protein
MNGPLRLLRRLFRSRPKTPRTGPAGSAEAVQAEIRQLIAERRAQYGVSPRRRRQPPPAPPEDLVA